MARRNALGQIDAYLSDWTPGSWSGTVGPNGEAGSGAGVNAESGALGLTGFQYNPQLMESGWWNQQGFTGPAFQTGQGEYAFDQPQMTPELMAWAQANGYAPGFTEGYGGILKDGQIQAGTAQGNRTNDDRTAIAGQLGLLGVGAYANAAGVGADFGSSGVLDVPIGELSGSSEYWGQLASGAAPETAQIGGDLMAGYGGGLASSGGGAASLVAPGATSGASLVAPGAVGGVGTLAGFSGAGTSNSSGLSSQLGDFFSGNGNLGDYGRVAQGLYGLYSNNRATDAAQQGAQDQAALIRDAMAKNQPLIDTRDKALGGINALMADPSGVRNDPGYQFGLKQGQDQINNQLAAKGGYYSGQQLKASQQFGQDYAGTKLDQSLNRLMGVAGLGQIGSNQNNGLTLNLGQNAATQGNIRGSGYIGQGNTVGNTIGDLTNDWLNRKAWGGGP